MSAAITVVKADATSAGISIPAMATIQTQHDGRASSRLPVGLSALSA
jgi:hypothetical protein